MYGYLDEDDELRPHFHNRRLYVEDPQPQGGRRRRLRRRYRKVDFEWELNMQIPAPKSRLQLECDEGGGHLPYPVVDEAQRTLEVAEAVPEPVQQLRANPDSACCRAKVIGKVRKVLRSGGEAALAARARGYHLVISYIDYPLWRICQLSAEMRRIGLKPLIEVL